MQYIKGIVYNCVKLFIEILILQFNKIHVALSNYLDVVNENETFFFFWFASVVMLWNVCLNAFFIPAKIAILQLMFCEVRTSFNHSNHRHPDPLVVRTTLCGL
jgi:hypothetical protein